MDKLKSHIKEHEELMNIEHAGDHVWQNIRQSLIKTATIVSTEPTHSLRHSNRIARWSFRIAISVLVIFSLAFRIKDSQSLGNIISFDMETNRDTSIQRFDVIEMRCGCDFKRAKNTRQEIASYIGITSLDYTRAIACTEQLKQVPGVKDPGILPVKRRTSESILSKIVYKISNIHLDLKQTTDTEITNDITSQLREKGIENIQLRIHEDNQLVELISFELPVPEQKTNNLEINKDSAGSSRVNPPVKTTDREQEKSNGQLNIFNWILHTWKTCDSTLNSYHRWIRINDSVYRSFVITLEPLETFSPAYFLSAKTGSVTLGFEQNSWSLQESTGAQFVFTRNDDQFPQKIKWELKQPGWWFARIRATLKDETCMYIDDSKNRQLDEALNDYKKQHPELFK